MHPFRSLLFWFGIDALLVAGMFWLVVAIGSYAFPLHRKEMTVIVSITSAFEAIGMVLIGTGLLYAGLLRLRSRHHQN